MRVLQSLSLFVGAATALDAAGWRSQSIYQVITDRFANDAGTTTQKCDLGNYCGGTWRGIINKLDYIQGMGFTAIWISPVVKNIGATTYGYPYHGYWAQDMYSLNPAFGTADDLKALSKQLHDRRMYLMVDVALNHYASADPVQPVDRIDYTKLIPFNDAKYYHPYCPIDYDNSTSVQVCWAGDTVVPLPDLRTEDPVVQQGINKWIGELVANYSIDGLRLDSALAVDPTFWSGFVNASKVYNMGEVLHGNPVSFGKWQAVMDGMLNYPAYYWLIRAFGSKDATMSELANNLGWLQDATSDTTLLGNFIENHDAPRFASRTTDVGLLNNAVAFTTFNDGIPVVYYGQEQSFSGVQDPYNREALWPSLYANSTMYNFIGKLNAARNVAIFKDGTYVTTKAKIIYNDLKVIVSSKGATANPLISLITNYGSGGSGSVIVSGVPASVAFTDLLTCEVFTSTSEGKMTLSIVDGQPRALYKKSLLAGNNPCVPATTPISELRSIASTTTSTKSISTSSISSSLISTSKLVTSTSTSNKSTSSTSTFSISKTFTSTSTSKKSISSTSASSASKIITSTTSTKGSTPSTSTSCSETSVAVTFNANVTTVWLENAKILGSDSRIGAWNTTNAAGLASSAYTSTNTIWSGTVAFPPGTYFEYKIVKVNSASGAVTYEGGSNRLYTVPCAKTVALKDTFQ